MTTPKTPPTPQQEVALALTDFFVDKDKQTKVALAPTASKLAWAIKRLTGSVGYEDLDQIQSECPKPADFEAFVARVVAVEKKLGPGSLELLTGLVDLKAAEALPAPAKPARPAPVKNTPEL